MRCSFCNKKAIYNDGKTAYCKEHFIEYFENKILNTIKTYNLIEPGEKVAVAVSGGKDSVSLLYLLNKYKEDLEIDVVGIHIDEGIKNYRDKLKNYLLNLAKKYNWEIKVYKFRDYFGFALDDCVKIEEKLRPCTICGVWRRWLMWKAAKDLDVDKIATAHNLNDEVQTMFINLFEGNIKDFVKGGPVVGIVEYDFVPKIKPFYLVTEKETTIYALINKIEPPWVECPYIYGQTRDEIRKWLYKLEEYFPGFHKRVINKYLGILNKLKVVYKKESRIDLRPCKYCKYPTSRDVCRACEIKMRIFQRRWRSS